MIYNRCPDCGANLDHGEKCDCKNNSALIIVKQIPIIETRLREIKEDIAVKVKTANDLAVTAENKQTAKKLRTDLKKDFDHLEDLRKQVKTAVMAPYNEFETLYKDIITTQFNNADNALKGKITAIEDVEINSKKDEILLFFNEYASSLKIDFIPFEKTGIKINLSASQSSLKQQAKTFLDNVNSELSLIDTQEFKDEILLEYKATGNCSQAITIVVNRHKALEQMAETQQKVIAEKTAEEKAEKQVETIIAKQSIAPPVIAELPLTLVFKVTATREKLKALKDFLIEGEYEYGNN